MSDMALGMTERLKPIHERVGAHGPRRDHAARRGIPGRDRQGRRRPLGAHEAPDRNPRRAEGQGQGARPVEFLADRLRTGLRAQHRRICLSRRRDGQGASRRRNLQLLGARHRQHGGAGTLRLERAQAAMAGAAARRQDPLGLSDDRAGRRLVRRHQHRHALRARWRRLCAQRREMVGVRRRRSALRDLYRHGEDRRRRPKAPAAFDDPGAVRHQGHHQAPADEGLWRRRRAAWPHASALRRRAGAEATI